jgi:hypothetical protein
MRSDDRLPWEKGRKFPHKYNVITDGACSYGCGCRIGPYRSSGPDGVSPYGECPSHPDRPNIAQLSVAAMTCTDDNVHAEIMSELADDWLRFGLTSRFK